MALDPQAVRWLDDVAQGRLRAAAPEIAFAETAHALARYVRAGKLGPEQARALLHALARFPLTVESLRGLVEAALAVALARGLTVYDACYAALAEASGAVLVTADARLAAAVPRSELLVSPS